MGQGHGCHQLGSQNVPYALIGDDDDVLAAIEVAAAADDAATGARAGLWTSTTTA